MQIEDLEIDENRMLLKACDPTGDGAIAYKPFVAFVLQDDTEPAAKPEPASRPSASTAVVIPDRIITDLRTKLRAAVTSKGVASIEALFAEADLDKSGTLTQRQFDNCLRDARVWLPALRA